MVSAEELERLYVNKGMTQGEIAEELGYSQPYISRKMSEYGIDSLGVQANIQQNNVWVKKEHAGKFFENIDSVIRTPS